MDKKSRNIIIISVVALAIVLITVTYAYFSARITGIESASTISLTAGRMEIVYTEGNEQVILNNIYPREEAWITKTFTLTGYNTTALDMKYDLGLNVETNTFPDDYLTYDLRLVSSTNGTPIATKTGLQINGTGVVKMGTGIFTNADGDTHNYELKIYFKDSGLDQNDAQQAVFNAKINVSDFIDPAPAGWRTARTGSLLAGIRDNNTLSEPLTAPGKVKSYDGNSSINAKNYINNYWTYATGYTDNGDGTYTLTGINTLKYLDNYADLVGKYIVSEDPGIASKSVNEPVSGSNLTKLLYVYNTSYTSVGSYVAASIDYTDMTIIPEAEMSSASDDFGTSYYFRGAVENNYLSFAGMCWRIVRVDGAGNTKLVLYNYNPNNVSNPCLPSEDGDNNAFARVNGVYKSAFNTTDTKNAHIGFMYSSNPTSNDFNIAHSNDIDSTILTFLKSWYDEKLRSYNDKIADVIWCNDKSIVTDTSFNPRNRSNVKGTGLNEDVTYYQSMFRLAYPETANPTYICSNVGNDGKLSKFTARDSINGNAKLYSDNKEYKIGLLTADEMAFAGASRGSSNVSYYLRKNAKDGDIWTMTPDEFTEYYPLVWAETRGKLNGLIVSGVGNPSPVRPSIALKSDTTISGGNGTQSNPFVVN